MADELVHGIDVSNWQAAIDWPAVAAAGVRFAWCKATESMTYSDPTFFDNMRGARAAGIPVGAYHFARPRATGAIQQAQWFRILAPVLDLPAVLDAEAGWIVYANGQPDRRANTLWVLDWFESVGEATRVLYTNPDGLEHLYPTDLYDAGVELFLARPTGRPDLHHQAGYPVQVVQYGGADIDGIDGPADVDAMTAPTFARYTGTSPAPDDDESDDNMIVLKRAGNTSVIIDGKHVELATENTAAQLAFQHTRTLDLTDDEATWNSFVHNFGEPAP